jgi:hypothetical protein
MKMKTQNRGIRAEIGGENTIKTTSVCIFELSIDTMLKRE